MSKKPVILLLDDEPDLVTLVRKRLENAGYQVISARDGEEGLKKARSNDERPDLILLDIMMPKINGNDVCIALKKDPHTKSIPIVMFTAKAREVDEALAQACGADAYIRKPYDAKELLTQVEALLPPQKDGSEHYFGAE